MTPIRFADQPVLNSPYAYPTRHWELDHGQPSDRIAASRRPSAYITPAPPSLREADQPAMVLGVAGLSTDEQQYDPSPIINEIRRRVDVWRSLPNPAQWGVTPETARLLRHWRSYDFPYRRPFFCQLEAAETVIWLTEVARLLPAGRRPRREHAGLHAHLAGANAQANPELFRLALKLATGAGKTTVMAMLIAWQSVNAARYPRSRQFTRGFLIVTPGITIRDRLRALRPNDPDNYYEHRDLVPKDLLGAVRQAQVIITNYHALRLRETESIPAGSRHLLQGRGGPPPQTLETEGQMLRRVMPELLRLGRALVLNDEGHHCYRRRADADAAERELDDDEKPEAEANNEQARVWISGLEAVGRKIGVPGVLDLSATPFFLRGSGYAEGTLFPWTVCDFSLMDAIESGIVKIPRVPISDNVTVETRPVFRELWRHVRSDLPRAGRRHANAAQDPLQLPPQLITALESLYGSYEQTFREWRKANIETPPVFIIVCQNTAISKLIYEYIAGFERPGQSNYEPQRFLGRFDLLRNYDANGQRRAQPRTLLIDSEQLAAADALPDGFRRTAQPAIDRFARERAQRGEPRDAESISDAELLREMMNTVGKSNRLGAEIRCVVSVSMLTEGWDANTVTHILGVRAFGTQLLCEQVVGRALRRQSYELNNDGLFDVEYAEVLGVPFDFSDTDDRPKAPTPPAPTVRVHAVTPERDHLEIRFPIVTGYRVELPNERISARFDQDSHLYLTTEMVGPTRTENQGIVGAGVTITAERLRETRRQQIVYELTAHILQNQLREPGATGRPHLFPQLKAIVEQWLTEYLHCDLDTYPAQALYPNIANLAGERIKAAIANAARADNNDDAAEPPIKAILAPYTPLGSTRHVNFTTTRRNTGPFVRQILDTDPQRSHLNRAVCESSWEANFCRILESHPQVIAYAKNYGLGLEVPYKLADAAKTYQPDFIVQINDGQGPDNPLNLIAEVKGYRNEDAQAKARTMQAYWIPGVNNLRTHGRWEFHEFRSAFDMAGEFDRVVRGEGLAGVAG